MIKDNFMGRIKNYMIKLSEQTGKEFKDISMEDIKNVINTQNRQNYISYLKESDNSTVKQLISEFESKKITFDELISMISPVHHGLMSFYVFCKNKKIEDLFKNM